MSGVLALRTVALSFTATVIGCASAQPPPGGPERREPPILLRVTPDTNAVNVTPRAVVFYFDEVIDDHGTGKTSLADLVQISPRDGPPDVDWRRRAIAVRPSRGWRANTPYTVTLLPGVADLRGNVRREPAEVIFSTGPSLPRTRLAGTVFDWVAGKPAPKALIEAVLPADTTVAYVAVADSLGRFVLARVPPGRYRVRGTIDLNNNRLSDRREPFDTVTVTLVDSAATEILAFVHDTTPPRIAEVTPRDSTTLRVAFDHALALDWKVDSSAFTLVQRRDSAVVPIAEALAAADYEQRETARARRADSLRAAAAPLPAVPLPRLPARSRADSINDAAASATPSRPSPVREIIIRTTRPLTPQTAYRLTARDVRGLLGRAAPAERTFSTPKLAVRDSTARPAPRRPTPVPPRAPTPTPPSPTRLSPLTSRLSPLPSRLSPLSVRPSPLASRLFRFVFPLSPLP
ncbi:MAG: hypothetical protein NVS1B4_24710 [Gemmatimonadaceae bacterium]